MSRILSCQAVHPSLCRQVPHMSGSRVKLMLSYWHCQCLMAGICTYSHHCWYEGTTCQALQHHLPTNKLTNQRQTGVDWKNSTVESASFFGNRHPEAAGFLARREASVQLTASKKQRCGPFSTACWQQSQGYILTKQGNLRHQSNQRDIDMIL